MERGHISFGGMSAVERGHISFGGMSPIEGVIDVNESSKHSISVNGRKQLAMEGVQHVESFDDSEIILETNMGMLILKGEGLHITQLSLETGTLAAEGFFTSIQYMEGKGKGKGKGKGLLKRILK